MLSCFLSPTGKRKQPILVLFLKFNYLALMASGHYKITGIVFLKGKV